MHLLLIHAYLRLRDERGLALPMVIGMMMVFSITVMTVVVYSSASSRAADAQRKSQYAGAAAESALATAIGVLGTAADPTVSAALPSCATPTALSSPPPGTGASYCGSLNGMDWTITARGWATTGTSAQTTQVRTKTITQVASIVPFYAAGLGPLWDRIYQYDTSKCAVFNKMQVTVPVVVRGCAQLVGDDTHPTRLLGSSVSIGGNVTLKDQDSIGLAASPVPRVDIAGTCNLEHGTGVHQPCSSLDAVYASSLGAAPNLARPSVDFNYWYTNAKPGPMQNCTVGSLPTGYKFDKNTTYNRDGPPMQLTPSGVDYTCQVWSIPPNGGQKLGEISWDSTNQILTVNGTIFFDEDVKATAPGHSKACLKADHGPYCDRSFSYNGRGTIYTAGKMDIEAGLCSGGDGSNDCETNPSSWDPTQNLLIFITGGLKNIGDETFTMKIDEAVFQGAVWTYGKCKVSMKASFSAPMICGQLGIKEDLTLDDPTINPWPPSLIGTQPGQVYPAPPGDFQIMLHQQFGA